MVHPPANIHYLCSYLRIMIVVTGAAGFIGSCLVAALNQAGIENLLLVDDFSKPEKNANLTGKKYAAKVDRRAFITNPEQYGDIELVYHIGARTDTTEFDQSIFDELNVSYSKSIWKFCTVHRIPLIYASSAATYGDGSLGFSDNPSLIPDLQPLNPYGRSKQEFDLWVLKQKERPPVWVGLKFFNVFGPNEYHKGRMASVIYHAFSQISETGRMKLFMSHHPDYENGGQKRDFIYVKDVVNVLMFWAGQRETSGIFNLGTGASRTFNDLAKAVFEAMDLQPEISYIPTPEDIRDKYQYYTQADMIATRKAGYHAPFTPLEDAVKDYVQHYLSTRSYW